MTLYIFYFQVDNDEHVRKVLGGDKASKPKRKEEKKEDKKEEKREEKKEEEKKPRRERESSKDAGDRDASSDRRRKREVSFGR